MASVDIVYIPVDQVPVHARVEFATGMTVANVLEQSGLLKKYPELADYPVGIFSRIVQLSALVKAGDRVELYRPLRLDPMEIRRQRAKKK